MKSRSNNATSECRIEWSVVVSLPWEMVDGVYLSSLEGVSHVKYNRSRRAGTNGRPEKVLGDLPNLNEMFRFGCTEEILNVDNQWFMRQDESVIAVGRTGRGIPQVLSNK